MPGWGQLAPIATRNPYTRQSILDDYFSTSHWANRLSKFTHCIAAASGRNPVWTLRSLGRDSIWRDEEVANAMATTSSSPPTIGGSLDVSLIPLPLPVSSSAALPSCVSRTGCCGLRRLFGRNSGRVYWKKIWSLDLQPSSYSGSVIVGSSSWCHWSLSGVIAKRDIIMASMSFQCRGVRYKYRLPLLRVTSCRCL